MNWEIVELGDVLKYEQPTKYLVDSTDYDDSYATPVLTAGKTFLLGYTNETNGIFDKGATIIFDDFTTAFKYVDFPFKVKSSAMKILQADTQKADIRFLYYRMLKTGIDTTLHKRYWISKYSKIKIPLPPLPIQKKIAAILDAADNYRQKTKALIDKYDQLTQSIFLDMFGDPVKNEKGWEVGVTIDGAKSIVPTRDKPKSFTGDTPWIRTEDLVHLGCTSRSKKNIGLSDSEIEAARCRVIPKNSVVMTCVGDLGVVSLMNNNIIMNQQLHAFVCDEEILNPHFLMYALSFQKSYYYKMASNTTVPYLNKTKCNNTPMIFPPLRRQLEFAKLMMKILSEKKSVNESNLKSEDLFQSLLQKAFKGELVS